MKKLMLTSTILLTIDLKFAFWSSLLLEYVY